MGDNFGQGNKLEILQINIHFYRGLESPYETGTPLFSDYWIPNGDGTYKKENKFDVKKYHPFALYFMGLLPKEEFNTKFQIYNAGPVGQFNFLKATPYKKVDVNDIIAIEGERKET